MDTLKEKPPSILSMFYNLVWGVIVGVLTVEHPGIKKDDSHQIKDMFEIGDDKRYVPLS